MCKHQIRQANISTLHYITCVTLHTLHQNKNKDKQNKNKQKTPKKK